MKTLDNGLIRVTHDDIVQWGIEGLEDRIRRAEENLERMKADLVWRKQNQRNKPE